MTQVLYAACRALRRYVRKPSPLRFPSGESMPETALHLRLRTTLFLVLERALGGHAFVGSDQFVYWAPADPRACLAPDVFVRLGGPLGLLPSFKTWEHGAPHVAVEIVSRADGHDRDLEEKLERYKHCGVGEVVRFDPEAGEPLLRFWDFLDGDLIERDQSDPEAMRCDALGAYWCLVPDPVLGTVLRLAAERDGRGLWLTQEEAERAEKEAERAEKEAALRRVAELEAELRRSR